MIRLITEQIDKIDTVFGAIMTFTMSLFGTGIYKSTEIVAQVSNTDPTWYCNLAPILQTIAWITAIAVGVVTFVKYLRELRGKQKAKKQSKK